MIPPFDSDGGIDAKEQERCPPLTLTKDRIVDSIYKNADFKKLEAARVFGTLMEIMKYTLSSGDDILISGFGKFVVKENRERRGRNPQTRIALILDARRVITFTCSGVLRTKLNGEKKMERKQQKQKIIK